MVYIAINATILPVTLWYVDCALVLKCKGCGTAGWELGWQGTHRKAVYNGTGGEGQVCECTG